MLKRVDVLDFLKGYCEEKRIPLSRAKEQLLVTGVDFAILCASNPNAPKPDGLANDIETQMLPTLYVRKTTDGYELEETEYTEEYLIKAAG